MNELELIRNHFLGFHNDFFDNIRRVSTYPPYNIKENDDKGVIEFAVAGFAEKDLKVEVKENTLSVYGCKESKDSKDLSGNLVDTKVGIQVLTAPEVNVNVVYAKTTNHP